MPTSVLSPGKAHRRGLVLGLTMAEVVILIVFILLLAFAAAFQHELEASEDLAKELDAAIDERDGLLAERALLYERLALPQGGADDFGGLFQELVLRRAENDSLRARIPPLEEKARRGAAVETALAQNGFTTTDVEALAREMKIYADLKTAAEELDPAAAGASAVESLLERVATAAAQEARLAELEQQRAQVEALVQVLEAHELPASDPEVLGATLSAMNEAAELLQAHAADADDAGAWLEQQVLQAARLDRENGTLRGQIEFLKHRLTAGGHGRVLPACWTTAAGRSEYIFNVALTSRGLIVRDNALPHRRVEQGELPLAIDFERELQPAAFRQQTRSLFEQSVERDCRFYVRVFDLTGPDEKAVYKRQLRALEDHFFKYEVRDASF